jgi:REP element-mobilizing transposase RayT
MRDDTPHARNLRRGRVSAAGNIYHVIFQTHDRAPLLDDLRLGRMVVEAMRWQDAANRTATLAFVVMPDHVHWLFTLSNLASLRTVVSSVKGFAAWRINTARHATNERVWQTGYFDHAVRREEDVRAIARYIIGNPLRAGLVTTLADYPLWDTRWI